jgi:glycosyltransferase involved in cell wall biosynthesis
MVRANGFYLSRLASARLRRPVFYFSSGSLHSHDMAKPRIFAFTTAYYPFIGGAEIAIQEVAKRLAREFDFFILTARFRRSLARREIRPEGTIIRLGLGTRFDKWILPFAALFYFIWDLGRKPIAWLPTGEAREFAEGANFGIWNFAKPRGFALWGVDIGQGGFAAAFLKSIFPRMPFILTLQYGESEERLHYGRHGINLWAFKRMLRRTDYLTAISTYLLDLARRYDYCGPAEVIHNGVAAAKFQIPRLPIGGQANPKSQIQKSKTIITVSRLVEKNGVDILIRAVAEVKKTIPDVRCRIIGDGPAKAGYQSLVTNYQLEANVIFLGEILHEEIPKYLHQADVFVRPSRSEGMGNAFVEALAAGVPIIGTPVGGITDIIEDGRTGLLVRVDDPRDLAQKVIRIFSDSRYGDTLARAGLEKISEKFSWGYIIAQYRVIFRRALEVKKNVVIATGLFPPEIGGPATYGKLLSDELPQRGISVRIIPFRSVRGLPKGLRHLVYFVKILAASRGADAVFAQDPVSTGFPAMLAAKLLGRRFIIKIVGDYAWEQGAARFDVTETLDEFLGRKYGWRVEFLRRCQSFAARGASRIIVPSVYLKNVVICWGIPAEKILVIHNAFVPPVTADTKEEARRRLGITRDALIIVSAGRLVPWKGFKELIEAMPMVRREIPSALLFIIGSGPEEKGLKAAVSALRLDDAVVFTGGVAHEKLLLYLRAGDLFLLNSSYEGFSHTLLEAMAMGIPVAARKVGGNTEVTNKGEAGVLYERNDSDTVSRVIRSMYADPHLLAENAAKGIAAAGRFTKEAMIEKTAGLLLSL